MLTLTTQDIEAIASAVVAKLRADGQQDESFPLERRLNLTATARERLSRAPRRTQAKKQSRTR